MQDETHVIEPSISDLRTMLRTPEAAPETPAAETAKAAEAKTIPDPEPVKATQEAESGKARGEDGKFKAGTPKGDSGAAGASEDEGNTPNVQKRIDKAVWAQHQAERERDEARTALAKSGSPPAKQETAQPAAATGEPDSAKFETYEAYVKALTRWEIRQADERRESRAAARAGDEAHNARLKTVKTETGYEDYDDVIGEAGSMPISRVMHEAIRVSEAGPKMAYYLAKNQDEAARIAKLSPTAGAMAMGALAKELSQPPAKPAAEKPLPKPAAKVGGAHAPHAGIDLNDPKIDLRTFRTEFKKQLLQSA